MNTNLFVKHRELNVKLAKPAEAIKATMTAEQLSLLTHLHKLICDLSVNVAGSFGDYTVDDDDLFSFHEGHMITGIIGELGELLDAFKKHIYYNKPLDVDNVREEIGDVLFYIAYDDENAEMYTLIVEILIPVAEYAGITITECVDENVKKLLHGRYSDGKYSDKAATIRADKLATELN